MGGKGRLGGAIATGMRPANLPMAASRCARRSRQLTRISAFASSRPPAAATHPKAWIDIAPFQHHGAGDGGRPGCRFDISAQVPVNAVLNFDVGETFQKMGPKQCGQVEGLKTTGQIVNTSSLAVTSSVNDCKGLIELHPAFPVSHRGAESGNPQCLSLAHLVGRPILAAAAFQAALVDRRKGCPKAGCALQGDAGASCFDSYLSKNGCPETGGCGAARRTFRILASSNSSDGTNSETGVKFSSPSFGMKNWPGGGWYRRV